MIIAVTLEGVLVKTDRRPLFESKTVRAGVEMANALGEIATVIVVTSIDDRQTIERWMKARGPRHDLLLGPWSGPVWRADTLPPGHDRVARLQEAGTGGSRISLAIESDPIVAAAMLANGFPVLLAAWPASEVREWSTEPVFTAPAAWADIVAEMERQQEEAGGE